MKIVFVCTGNASRSAGADVVLKKMFADNGTEGVEVSSCGTKVSEGLDREDVMCRIAAKHGYDMGGKAVPILFWRGYRPPGSPLSDRTRLSHMLRPHRSRLRRNHQETQTSIMNEKIPVEHCGFVEPSSIYAKFGINAKEYDMILVAHHGSFI